MGGVCIDCEIQIETELLSVIQTLILIAVRATSAIVRRVIS